MSAVSPSDSQCHDSPIIDTAYLRQSPRKKRTLSNSSSHGLDVTEDNNSNINLFNIQPVTEDTHEQYKLPTDEHGDRMGLPRCRLRELFFQNSPPAYGSPVARDMKDWMSPKHTSRWKMTTALPRPLDLSEALEPMNNNDGPSLPAEDKLIKRQRTCDLFSFEASTADDSWVSTMTPISLCSSQPQQGGYEQVRIYSNDAPNTVSKSPHQNLSPSIGNSDPQLHSIDINNTYIMDVLDQNFCINQETTGTIEQRNSTPSPLNRPADVNQAMNQKMNDDRHFDTKSKIQQSADQLDSGIYSKGNNNDRYRSLEHDNVKRQHRSKSDRQKQYLRQNDITGAQIYCNPEQQSHSQHKDQQSSHHRDGMENRERQHTTTKQTLSQSYTNQHHQLHQTQADTFPEKVDHQQQHTQATKDEENHTRECTTLTNQGDKTVDLRHAKNKQLRQEMETLTESVETLRTHYRLLKKVGCGTFSSVYKALDILHNSYDNSAWISTTISNSPSNLLDSSGKEREHNAMPSNQPNYVALKQIYSTSSPKRIAQEIKILKYLRGAPNVCQLITAFRSKDHVFLVMPYFKHYDFMKYYRDMDLMDTKYYMKALLTALQYLHGHRILHRDIKPNNFLYDKQQKTGILIDFGLAQMEADTKPPDPPKSNPAKSRSATTLFRQRSFVSPSTTLKSLGLKSTNDLNKDDSKKPGYVKNDQRKPVRASNTGTRGFRAPEVLLRVTHQTIAIDVWAVGVILLSLLTSRFPFFIAHDESDSLIEIASIFGMAEMKYCAALHNRTFETNIRTIPPARKSLFKLCQSLNTEKFNLWAQEDKQNVQNAIDLVEKMLTLNCKARITAEDALKHPFLSDTLS